MLGWFSGDPNNLATDFSSATPVQIIGTSTFSNANVNLQLGGGAIQGRITRSDNGQPVPAGTTVIVRGPLPRASQISPARLTDAQGNYSFSGLPPGQYAVISAEPNQVANGTAIGFFPFGAVSRSTGVPVIVTDGATTAADFQVLGFTGGASPRVIRGTVRDPSNNPIREAYR